MFLIIDLICLLFFYIGYRHYGEYGNPVSCFACVWGGIVTLNGLNLYGTSEISFNTWLLVITAVIGYFIGTLSPNRKIVFGKQGSSNFEYSAVNADTKLNVIFVILQVVAIIYMLMKAYTVLSLLLSGKSYDVIRAMYNWGEDSELGISAMESMFRMYFIDPFSCASLAIFVWLVSKPKIRKNKYEKCYIILSLIIIALHCFAYAERAFLVLILILMIFCRNIFKNMRADIENTLGVSLYGNKKIIVLGVIVAFAIVYITLKRVADIDLLKTIDSYFGNSLHLLDIQLNNFKNDPTFTYGLTFLMGIIRLPMTFVCKIFLGIDYPALYEYASNVSVTLQSKVVLSSQISLNAFATPIYYHYVDGGIIGVFIGFLVYGIIMKKGYLNAVNSGYAPRQTIFYLILFMTFYYQIVRWQFYRPQFVFAFVYAFIFTRKMISYNLSEER